MGLIIYNENKEFTSAVGFLKDVQTQLKIREVQSDKSFNISFISVIAKIIFFSGIAKEIEDIHKADIKKMILSYFKHLSLNEVTYAFELERYGKLGDKTEHFQLFDASYVSAILKKYENWKVTKRREYNLHVAKLPEKTEVSQKEKDQIVINGLENVFVEYNTNGVLQYSRLYLYDFFWNRNLLPKDVETKNAVYKMACENIKKRVSLTREETLINSITDKDGKPSNEVIKECHRITLERFFDNFTTIEQLLNKLK